MNDYPNPTKTAGRYDFGAKVAERLANESPEEKRRARQRLANFEELHRRAEAEKPPPKPPRAEAAGRAVPHLPGRERVRGRHAQIPAAAFDLPDLEHRVYSALCLHRSADTGECWPKVDKLCELANRSKRRVYYALDALEKAGWIERRRRIKSRRGFLRQTVYYLPAEPPVFDKRTRGAAGGTSKVPVRGAAGGTFDPMEHTTLEHLSAAPPDAPLLSVLGNDTSRARQLRLETGPLRRIQAMTDRVLGRWRGRDFEKGNEPNSRSGKDLQ